MKPSAFDYHAPSTIEEALVLLRDLGPDARPLAGGQSLVPMMNFRITNPSHLVDLNRVSGLSYVRVENGHLCIGAMTRHRDVEHSEVIKNAWPLLSGAMKHVGHVQIRNRGTIGGSLSHADPAAELPAIVGALDGELMLRGAAGTRTLRAEEFFLGVLTTAAQPDELLVEIRIPALPAGTSWAFDELSRRRGDFAIVGVAAVVRCDRSKKIDFARLTFAGVGEKYVRSRLAEEALLGKEPVADAISEAARVAASELDPPSDLHASANYRRQVAEVMAERVLSQAVAQQKAWAQ
jgi:aerobic carbon-monoxide dehydrogenase medium subunit